MSWFCSPSWWVVGLVPGSKLDIFFPWNFDGISSWSQTSNVATTVKSALLILGPLYVNLLSLQKALRIFSLSPAFWNFRIMCLSVGPGYRAGNFSNWRLFFFFLRYTLLKIHSFRMHGYICFDNYTHHVIILHYLFPTTEKKFLC